MCMETYFEEEKEEEILEEKDKNVALFRQPWAVWTVGDEEYKLKLTTSAVVELEKKLKGNLLNVFDLGSVPPLNIMLGIIQAGMKKYHHGITMIKMYELFDEYVEDGGSQMSLMMNVLMPLYQVSGFFSEKMSKKMNSGLEEAKEEL